MALTPAFTIAQSALAPNLVVATDTSTGSDGAITQRRIFFQTSSGTYLVESGILTSYMPWALADVSESFDILTSDQAVAVIVQWLDVSNTVLYTLTQLYCLEEFNKQYLVQLGALQAVTPGILQDNNYATNLAVYYAYIVYAEKMVSVGGDIANSQNLLNKATYMMQNANFYF